MSENIRQFIDQLASGSNSEAKDTLENELASRAFSSLDEYKKELAGSIFGGNQEQDEEELLAQEGFEQLIEDINVINEVSLGAKIKAYAHHSSQSFEHGDSGNDDEAEHHQKRADKILANISKHHGSDAAGHAEKAADSSIFGTDRSRSRGADKLSGGLRHGLNQNVTKSGKIPKATQSAMKNRLNQEELAMEEETEQLDELSNKTIQSYHTKATGIRKGGGNVDDKMQDHSYAASDAHDAGKKSLARYHDKKFNDLNDRYRKRGSGIDRAEKRLKINIPKV